MEEGVSRARRAAALGAPEGGVLAGASLGGFLEALLDPATTRRVLLAASLQGEWEGRVRAAGIACETLRLEGRGVLDTLMDAISGPPGAGDQVWLNLDRRLDAMDLLSLDAFLAYAATREHPPLVVLMRDDAPDLPRTQRLVPDRQGRVLLLRESGDGAWAIGAPELLDALARRGAGGGVPPETFLRPGPTERQLLVLDIDGVLIDPGRSFHEAVAGALAELSPGIAWDDEHYTAFKRVGGFNNDFRLAAAALALAERDELGGIRRAEGRGFPHLEARIQELEPLCQTAVQKHYVRSRRLERPIITREELSGFPGDVAIFTGRPPDELLLAYQVLGFKLPAVSDSASHLRKPRPEGLLQLADAYRAARVIFVGDTCDDASALRDARALCPGVQWVFAAVGPDRQWIAAGEDLQAPRLRDLLPRLATP